MQVVQVDRLHPQPGQGGVAVAVDALGAAVEADPRVVADDADLGSQHDLLATAADRPTDQGLVVPRAVAHRGVQQGHAEIERAANRAEGLVVVRGAVRLGQAHAPQPEGGGRQPVGT